METKGVASVRSPVCNLQQYGKNITHDAFVNAMVDEFLKEYPTTTPRDVCFFLQTRSSSLRKKVSLGAICRRG